MQTRYNKHHIRYLVWTSCKVHNARWICLDHGTERLTFRLSQQPLYTQNKRNVCITGLQSSLENPTFSQAFKLARLIAQLSSTTTQPFNGLFSRTTWVSRYQKGKTNLDFTGARDSELQWHQLGHMQACTSPQTDNHASTPPLCFLQAGCPSCRPTNSVKALKAQLSSTCSKKHKQNEFHRQPL